MARLIYGGTGGDVVAQISVTDGDYEPSTATFDVFTTRTGATQHTSLLSMAGGAITTVTPDADGWIRFQGQDTYTGSYWLQDQANPGDPRWRIDPAGIPERLAVVEAAVSGVGVTDGVKGDITVSGSGTIWDIGATKVGTAELADGAVTLAKQAQVATARILGRTTAATGIVEALTAVQVAAMLPAASSTVAGPVELDTDAEAIAGTDTTRAITAANLAAVLAAVPATTEAVQDIVGAFMVEGAKIDLTYDDTANTLTVAHLEPTPRTVTGSATLALGDANAAIYDTGGSANVLTVPTNAAVALPTDTQVDVWLLGAGALTITASATVTLNGVSAGSYTPAQYSRTVLRKTGTNAWSASGGGSTVGTLATVVAGSIFRCPWNGTAWTYAGTVLTDRPSTRTDIFFQLTGAPYATADPSWMLTGDDRIDL